MKAKPQKYSNTGKTGQIAGKHGKVVAASQAPKSLPVGKNSVGSAMGILGKHFK